MKKEYLKWVTKWMSEDYKDIMRDGIKRLYSADEVYTSSLGRDFVIDGNHPLEEEAIQEETLDLIYEAIRTGSKFGDVKIEHVPVEVYGTGKTALYTRITLPVESV